MNATEGDPFEVKGAGSSASGGDSTAGAGTGAGAPAEGGASGGVAGEGEGGGGSQELAGILTAGIWDDNLNFDLFQAYRDSLAQTAGIPVFTGAEQRDANLRAAARSPKRALDLALVIDTTGSMGDEISYLQAELTAISDQLRQAYPAVPQRWALIAYRDTQDDYILRGADFGTDISWFQKQLNQLTADGGGDIPEAPDQALAYLAQLSWNPAPDAAHLAFWVADAPPHEENANALAAAVRAAQALDVHVYPVASSGIDEVTEYTMRATAQLTLGRYAFLTDDSHVGNEHKDPSIPCYFVTKLEHALQRAIGSELEGSPLAIDPAQVIRTVGAPQNGVCALPDDTSASVF